MQDIILYNNGVRVDLEKGAGIEQVMEHWDMLQVNCAAFINSDLPGLPPNHSAVPSKPTRYCSSLTTPLSISACKHVPPGSAAACAVYLPLCVMTV